MMLTPFQKMIFGDPIGLKTFKKEGIDVLNIRHFKIIIKRFKNTFSFEDGCECGE
jgi:hypothetical protein